MAKSKSAKSQTSKASSKVRSDGSAKKMATENESEAHAAEVLQLSAMLDSDAASSSEQGVDSDRDEPAAEGNSAPAAAAGEGGGLPCWAACGEELGTINISTGSKRGTFLGKSCHAAFRGLRAHCKELQCLPQLTKFKRTHEEAFKAKIRSMRITDIPSLMNGASGVSNKEQQLKAMNQFVDETTSFNLVQNENRVVWLLQEEYIAHCKYSKNFPDDASGLRTWNADISNADVLRRGSGNLTRLAVSAPPATVGIDGTSQVLSSRMSAFCFRIKINLSSAILNSPLQYIQFWIRHY
jgi:hypothetical protein